jgi:hypothetical protein
MGGFWGGVFLGGGRCVKARLGGYLVGTEVGKLRYNVRSTE